ncbi:transposase [Candidatus Endoriftia persephone]
MKWQSWARRCRVPQIKKMVATIKAYLSGILNGSTVQLSNGCVEAPTR